MILDEKNKKRGNLFQRAGSIVPITDGSLQAIEKSNTHSSAGLKTFQR